MLSPAHDPDITEPSPASRTEVPLIPWLAWVAGALGGLVLVIGGASRALQAHASPVAYAGVAAAPLGVTDQMPDVAPAAAQAATANAPVEPARAADRAVIAPGDEPGTTEHVYQPEELPIAPIARGGPSARPARAVREVPPRAQSKRGAARFDPGF